MGGSTFLTKAALVPEQLLQAHDAAREALDLFLRLVDGRQALHDVDEGLVSLLEALVEALVDLARDLVQALVDLGGEPLARIGEVAPEPVALLGEPGVQIGEHRAVLFFQERRQRRRRILQPAFQGRDTPCGPDKNDERNDCNCQRDFNHRPL